MHGLVLGLLAILVFVGSHAILGSEKGMVAGQASVPAPVEGNSRVGPTPVAGSTPMVGLASSTVPASLSEELTRYVNGLDGTYGVAVQNLADGQTVLVNAERVFPAASLYKLLVMYRVYQAIGRGEISTETAMVIEADDLVEAEDGDGLSPGDSITVGEALDLMITFSSNPAAYVLARETGGWNEVLAAARELWMSDTTWDGSNFVTTPADILRFLSLLGRRALVSPTASDEMMAVLLRQKINDRIPAGLPPGTKVAHKTGELPEVRNDAGIVFGASGPYAIVIMSEGIDPAEASPAQAEISRMVYERLGT